MSGFGERQTVKLHVYDLTEGNGFLGKIGLGIYHTGVEICGKEWTFGDGGIFYHAVKKPPAADHCKYKCTEDLGLMDGTVRDISGIVKLLREERFAPGSYNTGTNNCNHFSEEFCRKLGCDLPPSWVNRMAGIGGWMLAGNGKAAKAPVAQSSSSKKAGGKEAAAPGKKGRDPGKRRELTEHQKQLLAKLKQPATAT